MFDLELFKKYRVVPNWNDIYYGIANDYLDLKSVSEYAVMCIESCEKNNAELMELVWENQDKNYLMETCSDQEKFFSTVDELYARFNYPEDMEEFVSYMPVKDDYDPSQHSKEENMKRLLRKVECFLQNKKNVLRDECEFER